MMNVSIWEKETFFAPQDIIIIGSGFVGLWSALYLKKDNPNAKITIVDRGIIPTGASTRNAGFACFGSLSEIIYDAHSMGTDKMLELVEMRFKGLAKINKYFKDKLIDFDLCGGYELYETSANINREQLNHNIEYINSLLKPITKSGKTYKLVDEKLPEFGFGRTKNIVKNNNEGFLHSGKLVQSLIKKVAGMGVQIFNQTEVLNLEDVDHAIALKTNRGISLLTRQVLICTNAFAKDLLPGLDIVPARGQVIVTSPIQNLNWKGTFHSDQGYYYFRNIGNRVLLGGARNKAFEAEQTEEMNTTEYIQSELETYLDEVVLPGYKGEYSIDFRWSGIMAMGSEKMPIVEEVKPGIFCAVRMSGMGVALSPVIGQTIASKMNSKV